MSKTLPDTPLSFEAAIAELEALVQQMESDQMPLEQSMQAFRRGAALLQHCQKILADVEQQIRILGENGQLQPYRDIDD
jgi:exodeoxyribonuclease VII small subunit